MYNFEDTSMLAYEYNDKKRKLRGAIEMLKHDEVNFKLYSEKIRDAYAHIDIIIADR